MIDADELAVKVAEIIGNNQVMATVMLNSQLGVELTFRGWLVIARKALDILEGKK